MLCNKIDTSKVKSEMNVDFEQIQKDLTKFKNHTSMPQDDVITLMNYIDKFERLIVDEDYNELEYRSQISALYGITYSCIARINAYFRLYNAGHQKDVEKLERSKQQG